MVREKLIFVREKSVKSQGISFQTKSGHPEHVIVVIPNHTLFLWYQF